jgi:hypothetical protein
VRLGGYRSMWRVDDVESLDAALAWRDARGGGIFWLSPDDDEYPTLAVRVSGEVADVSYFPREGHPGYRCLGGEGLPEGGMTTLVYEGAEPSTGEETPNEFVVSFERARSLASEFFRTKERPGTVPWFEL